MPGSVVVKELELGEALDAKQWHVQPAFALGPSTACVRRLSGLTGA